MTEAEPMEIEKTLCHGCVATSTETHPLGWDVRKTGVRHPVMAWFCPACIQAGKDREKR